MAIKRPHRKSRYGCDQCRKRRVKCDEVRPRCSNCTARRDTCCFSREAPPPTISDSSSNAKTSPSATSYSHDSASPHIFGHSTATELSSDSNDCLVEPVNWQSVRQRELRLMHHWCTRACHSFPRQAVEALRDHVAEMAFHHDFLMASMLALSSIQIACDMSANNAQTLAVHEHVSAGLQYQNEATAGLREVLPTISSENADAVFVASALLLVCALVSPLLPVSANHQRESAADAVLPIADFLKGIHGIISLTRHWLVQGPVKAMLGGENSANTELHRSCPTAQLRQMIDIFANRGNRQMFDSAIDALVEVSHNGRSVLPWLSKIGTEYVEELRQQNPIALAIFMVWGTLLDQDRMWWAQYSGKRLVEELSMSMALQATEWEPITGWCRVHVGL